LTLACERCTLTHSSGWAVPGVLALGVGLALTLGVGLALALGVATM
jgi:hypothetical protein